MSCSALCVCFFVYGRKKKKKTVTDTPLIFLFAHVCLFFHCASQRFRNTLVLQCVVLLKSEVGEGSTHQIYVFLLNFTLFQKLSNPFAKKNCSDQSPVLFSVDRSHFQEAILGSFP